MGQIFDRMGDKIVGVRVVVTYQDFTPKSGYKEAEDGSGRKAKVLKKSVRCRIEKAIRKR